MRGSVVGFDCRVEAGAVVEDSILFDRVAVGPGAEVRRAILDKGVRVVPGARVGVDPDEDRARGFVVSEGGVTCVAKDTVVGGRGGPHWNDRVRDRSVFSLCIAANVGVVPVEIHARRVDDVVGDAHHRS